MLSHLSKLAAAILVICSIGIAPSEAADPTGTWIMANGKVTVRVSRCSSKLCAQIVGLAEPRDRAGRRKVDKLNPNASLRKRPLIGLTLTSNLAPNGKDSWTGSIYNPDDGRTYSASLKLAGSSGSRAGSRWSCATAAK